eukprot:CAMPEP_0170171450 /NCGR_PEP_ID=MMETSP0040_2-20121228/4590_1 /TAXON_ID=641309 /ORGANISM="Lotharella oceanica, Strain CCMP622" /LENGTH=104 /DNA_ID=CAMNT_0010411503 /DNA_START=397 /DNA_END=711 /DNA_ORIENTATION=+
MTARPDAVIVRPVPTYIAEEASTLTLSRSFAKLLIFWWQSAVHMTHATTAKMTYIVNTSAVSEPGLCTFVLAAFPPTLHMSAKTLKTAKAMERPRNAPIEAPES